MDLSKEIEKSLPKIEKLFTEKTLSEFLQTPSDDLEKYNVGFGTMIRLRLLGPKSALYQKFLQRGFADRDDIAMEMIKAFHSNPRHMR